MVAVALAFAVLQTGGSAADVGLVLASGSGSVIAALLFGGVVADRVSRRGVMVVADMSRVLSQGTMAVLLISGVAEVWMLAALAAMTGAANGFFQPASTGLMPALVPPEQLQRANGMRATVTSVGEIGGPILAGAIVATASAGWAIAVDACTFAVSALLLLRIHGAVVAAREPTGFLTDLRDGWREFTARTWVWALVIGAALGNAGWVAFATLGPVVAANELGGAAVWGSVLAAMGVGVLIGSLLATAAKPRRPLVVYALTSACFVVPLSLLAVPAPAPLIAVGALLGGGSIALANSVWESTLQRHIPAASLSRVSSYDWFASAAFNPLAMAMWGPLAVAIGFTSALSIAAAMMLLVSAALFATPAIRQLPAFPTSDAAAFRSPPGSVPSSPGRAP